MPHAPLIVRLSSTPSATNPDIQIITIRTSEPVQPWDTSSLTLVNATAVGLTEVAPGREWAVELTPDSPGSFSVHLAEGALQTIDARPSQSSNTIIRNYEAPTAIIEEPVCWIDDPVELTVIWSKPLASFDTDLVDANGLDLSDWTQFDEQTWTVTASRQAEQDEVRGDILASAATDALGTPNVPAQWSAYSTGKPSRTVRPVLERVWAETDGTFTAVFGYLNENRCRKVHIAIGGENKFTPGPQDQGQPVVFKPGRQVAVFEIPFSGGNLVWTLRSPNGSGKTATAAAGAAVPRP